MAGYLVRRLAQSVVFMLVASLMVYTALVLWMPQGPAWRYERLQNNPNPRDFDTPGVYFPRGREDISVQRLEERYKLHKPWPLNYALWLFDPDDTTEVNGDFVEVPKGIDINILGLRIQGAGLLTGDFGKSESYASGIAVSELFGNRWFHTVLLVVLTLLVSVAVAIPIGIIGAMRHRTAVDHSLTLLSFAGLSITPYVLGLLLIIFLAVLPSFWHRANGWTWLPFFPAGGVGDERSLGDRLWHTALPVATLAIPQIAWLSRYARSSMLEVLRQDYIRTAWAKGLSSRRVTMKHALRNALLPMITLIALAVPGIASGAIIVESVFAYPGMGQLYYRSLGGCLAGQSAMGADPPPCPPTGYYPIDYPLALTLTITLIAIITLANLVADFLYTLADPRINFASRKGH